MRDKRLLERFIEAEERDELRAGRRVEERLIGSVVGHLSKLLNTRRGNAAIDPEYGLPDLTKLVATGADTEMPKVEALVQRVILKYEPRLSQVAVKLLGVAQDELSLRVELTGAIEHDGRRLPLRIRGLVTPEGRFELKP